MEASVSLSVCSDAAFAAVSSAIVILPLKPEFFLAAGLLSSSGSSDNFILLIRFLSSGTAVPALVSSALTVCPSRTAPLPVYCGSDTSDFLYETSVTS